MRKFIVVPYFINGTFIKKAISSALENSPTERVEIICCSDKMDMSLLVCYETWGKNRWVLFVTKDFSYLSFKNAFIAPIFGDNPDSNYLSFEEDVIIDFVEKSKNGIPKINLSAKDADVGLIRQFENEYILLTDNFGDWGCVSAEGKVLNIKFEPPKDLMGGYI